MGLDSESGEMSCEDVDSKSVCSSVASKRDKPFKCHHESCKAVFSRPWRLEAHLCVHSGERPFKCKEEGCTRAYSYMSHLRRHTKASHSATGYKEKYRCPHPDCGLELSSVLSVRRHYKRKHESLLPYNCPVCDKGFYKHSQLKTHCFEHTGVPPYRTRLRVRQFEEPLKALCRPGSHDLNIKTRLRVGQVEQPPKALCRPGSHNLNIKCELCETGFTTQRMLKRHMRGHRTYTCDISTCRHEFSTWTLLRKHYKLEHPTKYNCATCGREFHSKGLLNHHLLVHKERADREVYPCPHEACPRYYFLKKNLNHHIRSSHEGKKHKCTHPDCGRELSTKQKLQEHLKLHSRGPLNRKSTSTRKTRKERKDAGMPKRSFAIRLTGLQVPYEVEKKLLFENMASEEVEKYMLCQDATSISPHVNVNQTENVHRVHDAQPVECNNIHSVASQFNGEPNSAEECIKSVNVHLEQSDSVLVKDNCSVQIERLKDILVERMGISGAITNSFTNVCNAKQYNDRIGKVESIEEIKTCTVVGTSVEVQQSMCLEKVHGLNEDKTENHSNLGRHGKITCRKLLSLTESDCAENYNVDSLLNGDVCSPSAVQDSDNNIVNSVSNNFMPEDNENKRKLESDEEDDSSRHKQGTVIIEEAQNVLSSLERTDETENGDSDVLHNHQKMPADTEQECARIPMTVQKWLSLMMNVMDEVFPDIDTEDVTTSQSKV